METTDYVSYPLALALKKAGFDWKCDHIYLRTKEIADKHAKTYNYEFADWKVDDKDYNKRSRPQLAISAPTLWQAQKWLREGKGIAVSVQASEIQGELWYSADIITTKGINDLVDGGFDYMAYETALSAGIAAALELIEKKGE